MSDANPQSGDDTPCFGDRRGENNAEKYVFVTGGEGSWAYYTDFGVPNPVNVVIDVLCNPRAPHFAGKLLEKWTLRTENGSPRPPAGAWILTGHFEDPPREEKIYIEDEDAGLPRWERR